MHAWVRSCVYCNLQNRIDPLRGDGADAMLRRSSDRLDDLCCCLGAMKMPTTSDVIDVTSGLFGLVLIGSGAWYWYNTNVQAHGTKQIAETAAREIHETAECHMEAFKMRPGSTEAALEIQAEFMDLCMAAREYVFLPDCTERMREGDRAWNLSYKFNSVCWQKS